MQNDFWGYIEDIWRRKDIGNHDGSGESSTLRKLQTTQTRLSIIT